MIHWVMGHRWLGNLQTKWSFEWGKHVKTGGFSIAMFGIPKGIYNKWVIFTARFDNQTSEGGVKTNARATFCQQL